MRPISIALAACSILSALIAAEEKTAPKPEVSGPASGDFYLPENPSYTIVDSMLDSIRFTLTKTLAKDEKGHLVSISSFVNPEGEIMDWHDFGVLEGPGWAANAVGGAYEIYALGKFLGKEDWTAKALSILDHVLDCGFIDERTGFIRGYRITAHGLKTKYASRASDPFCLNYKHNSDWFCPGSMAKVAYQLLIFADELGWDPRASRMRAIADRTAQWLYEHVPEAQNGWFPRRITPDGKSYKKTPEGGEDRLWQTSADGLFILQLWAALGRRKISDYSFQIAQKTARFIQLDGIFGSINHDTYDEHENVAYAVAFRTFLEVSRVLKNEGVRAFAYSKCLAGLDRFKMTDDRNGVATKGLLYMEDSWPTAYLWENAEAALAYFEAALDLRNSMPEASRRHERDGLTILRAIAKHHHGPHGFLTEGVDWPNHVSAKHHIGGATYGDIQYTEPFLNNQHIAEPTLFYLRNLAKVELERNAAGVEERVFKDFEGNVLLRLPPIRARAEQPKVEKSPGAKGSR